MTNELFEEIDGVGAEISDDSVYRYVLRRKWDEGYILPWLMYNPSVADAIKDDPTIRRCIGFAKRWKYTGIVVLNLYALRSSDPKNVAKMGAAAVGPLNDYWIRQTVKDAPEIIMAWGCSSHHDDNINARIKAVIGHLRTASPQIKLQCLGWTKDRHPRHPSRLPYEMPRISFEVNL